MTGSDKTVKVRLDVETGPYAKGMSNASSVTRKLGSDIENVGAKSKGFASTTGEATKALKGMALAGAAVAGTALVAFLSDSVNAASDLNETVAKTGQIFGQEALPGLEKFAEGAAESLGQSKQQALDAAATFGVFGKSAGLAGEPLADFSKQMVELSSDMASFSNTSPEEAIEAIGAALRGEAEPIRKYGVLLDDATLRQRALTLGIIKTTKDALTPQQKVLAAQAEILAQTSDAQGDFARTSDGLANQQRILAAELENSKAALGEALLPAMNAAVGAMREGLDAALAIAAAFEKVPGPVKVAVGALIAFHLLRGPLGGFITTTIGQLKNLTATLRSGGIAAGAKATGSALMGAFGGPLGIAVGLGAAALTFWAQEAAKTDAIAQSLKDTIDKTSGAFTSQSKATVKEALFGDLSTEDIKRMQELGVNFDALADAALAGGPALQKAQAGLDGLKDFDALFLKDDADIIDGLMSSLDRAGQGAERSKLLFGELKPPADEAAKAVSGVAKAAIEAAGGAEQAIPEIDTLAIRQKTLAEAAAFAAQSHIDLAKAILEISDAAVSADQAEAAWQQAIDEATASIDKNGKTVNKARTEIDLSTDAGRKNQAALIGLSESALANAEALLTQGDSTQSVKDKMRAARKEFIDAATDMGLNKESAKRLATQYGLTEGSVDNLNEAIGETPAETKARITVEKAAAETAIAGITAMLNALDGRRITVGVTAATAAAVTSINNVGSLFGWKPPVRKAAGGYISGAGTATSDSIPALLSNGEYVLKAAAVAKYGKRTLDDLNAMRFAQGGFVSRMPQSVRVASPSAAGQPGPQNVINMQTNDPVTAARAVYDELEWRAVNG